jgi:hypothetical protein
MSAVEAHDVRAREAGDHLLLHRRWDRSVALVEHVRHRDVRRRRPMHGLEVVIDGVGDASNRVDDEGERVIVERVATVGGPKGLGVVRRSRQGDHDAVTMGLFEGTYEPGAVSGLHAVDAEPSFEGHERGAEDDVGDPITETGDDAGHDEPTRRVRHDDDRFSEATVSVARSARFPALPGRSNASDGLSRCGTSRSQKRAVDPPPCTSTNVMIGDVTTSEGSHRHSSGATMDRTRTPYGRR